MQVLYDWIGSFKRRKMIELGKWYWLNFVKPIFVKVSKWSTTHTNGPRDHEANQFCFGKIEDWPKKKQKVDGLVNLTGSLPMYSQHIC